MPRRETSPASTAEREYRDALAQATELGMRPLAAHCHAGLGILLLRAGERRDAESELDTARAMFREMAMWFWLEALEVGSAKHLAAE